MHIIIVILSNRVDHESVSPGRIVVCIWSEFRTFEAEGGKAGRRAVNLSYGFSLRWTRAYVLKCSGGGHLIFVAPTCTREPLAARGARHRLTRARWYPASER